MRLLFVHGHKFREVSGRLYSPGGLPNEVLGRYSALCDELTVIGRIIREEESKSSYSLISDPKVTILTEENLAREVERADGLIVRLPAPVGYRAIHMARKLKKPYLVEVVGCIWDAYWNYGLKGKLFALPAMLIMKHSVKNASHVVYVSQEFLQRRYPTRGRSVGISDVELQKMDDAVLAKRLERIAARGGKLIIGTTASVEVPYKGQEYVIRALPGIMKRLNCEVEYQLVGRGSPDRLRGIAQACGVADKVRFVGILSHDEVFNWLDGIDIYAQPSRQEGLCRALVEAMSRGLPCVASRVGGNPELLDADCVFSMRGDEAVVGRVTEAVCRLADRDRMRAQAERNFSHARAGFERETLEKKRNELFRDYIDSEVTHAKG